MGDLRLQLQGVRDPMLPMILLAIISGVLIAWGVRACLTGRRRIGLLAIAAALGPVVFAGAMVIDAAVAMGRNRSRAVTSLTIALAAIAATIATVLAEMTVDGGLAFGLSCGACGIAGTLLAGWLVDRLAVRGAAPAHLLYIPVACLPLCVPLVLGFAFAPSANLTIACLGALSFQIGRAHV